MHKKIWKNLELKTAIMLLIVIVLVSVILYLVFYNQYYGLIISTLQDDARVIHQYAESVIDEASFYELNTIEDEETELYKTTVSRLNEIRRIANILYLYTAKIDDDGHYIYVVDGIFEEELAEGAYFCHIGDRIEPEILPLLEQSLSGEIVLSDKILNTEWGVVFVAYFPFHDDDGNVIGAIGMEFDCETLYERSTRVFWISFVVAIFITIAFVIFAYAFIRRIVTNAESAFTHVEKGKAEAEDLLLAMMNASPMSCQYWNRDGELIDCNEAALKLFGFKNKKEYLKRWRFECNPDFQPDGHDSHERGAALVEKAFAEGTCVFEWMHQQSDGTPIPVEVTFTRIKAGNNYFIASYTKDLRREKALEEMAGVAYYDDLTGTYTKDYLDSRLPNLIRLLSRSDSEMSVLMVRIDFYDGYCSAYGKESGEKCLKAVTGILQSCMRRADDFVVRYRNDSWVVVLPNTGKAGAMRIAEKLLENVQMLSIPNKASPSPFVTLSVGITSGKVYHRQRSSDYINRADEMLYISSQGGNNRFTYGDL